MEVIHQLGINSTAVIQLIIYVMIFSYLSIFVFKPYFDALKEREKRTKGGEELAQEYTKKAFEIHSEYEEKAREVHGKIREIFHKKKSEALAEHDSIVAKAREEAGKVVDSNRVKISKAVAAAESDLHGQTTTVALAITNKLLGK